MKNLVMHAPLIIDVAGTELTPADRRRLAVSEGPLDVRSRCHRCRIAALCLRGQASNA